MDETIIRGGDHRQLWGLTLLSRELRIRSELGMRGPGAGVCCLYIYSSHQVFCPALAFQCPSQWPSLSTNTPVVLYLRTVSTRHFVSCLLQLVTLVTATSSSLSQPKNHMTWCSSITYFMQSHLGFQYSMTISNTHLYLGHGPLDS